MVIGNEHLFNNIDEAISYVLGLEQKAINADIRRHNVLMSLVRPMPPMLNIPVDSLDNPYAAWFNGAGDEKFVMTRLQSGRYSLKPNLRNRKYLFRGETTFHNPSRPSIFRKVSQMRFTKEMILGQELYVLMLSHPLVELLDTGVDLCGVMCRFEMNLYGLTQHYYNKTSVFDFTSDPLVAAFFATSEYDPIMDKYTPITDDKHAPGVLYYYSLDIEHDFKTVGGIRSPLSTIGLQVFPRSGRQKGFLFDVNKGDDLNDTIRLNAVRFKHNAVISNRLFNYYDGGKRLFPDDILMEHWLRKYKDKNVISTRAIRMNKHFNNDMSLAEIEKEVKGLGLVIQNYKPSFTSDELDEYYDAVKNKGLWTDFCNQIFIPGDKDGSMMNALMNLPNNPKYRWAFEHSEKHVIDYNKGYLLKGYKDCLE